MELAIPALAIAGSYLLSDKKCKKPENKINNGKETYVNMGKPVNYLPNMDTPVPNYPREDPKLGPDVINEYEGQKAATDKYYDTTLYENVAEETINAGNTIQDVYGLSGDKIDPKNFKHGNMVPFFGGKIRGATADAKVSESVLDNMQGTGSQHFKKQEVAPLFAPEENLQFANGAPNNSDFYQSRVNPSMRMANVKPWAEQKVAPGLDMGYGTEGSNGFNNGMEARDKWLPKTVNALRTANNPKVSYGLANHEGPASATVKNMGSLGKVEKYRPDTTFEWGQDRLFTTGGIETAPAVRGLESLPYENRVDTSVSYFGNAGKGEDASATYTVSQHEESKRQQLGMPNMGSIAAGGHGAANTGDYGRMGHKVGVNNRSTANSDVFGAVGGLIKAAVAPVMDVLRPTRKENVVGTCRPNGNVAVTNPSAPVYNPNEKARTTIREMTEGKVGMNHLNVQGQSDGAYKVSEHQPTYGQRDTTSAFLIGPSGGSATATGVHDNTAAFNQRNNVNKEYVGRTHQGGTQIFNQHMNVSIAKRDEDRNQNRWGVASGGPTAAPSTQMLGMMHGGSFNQERSQDLNASRLDSTLLDAFKSNPYTQSLNSH